MEIWFLEAAVSVGVVGAYFDIKSARIPNRLTYSAILAALILRPLLLGWHGLFQGLGGLLLGGGIFAFLFMIHTMGGGDVKLMAAVGALVGFSNTGQALIWCTLFGGLMAIGYVVAKKRYRATLLNLISLVRFHATAGAASHPELNLSNPEAVRMPYGVAIAVGALAPLAVTVWRGN
jgi:prepilin peptidase CpaA